MISHIIQSLRQQLNNLSDSNVHQSARYISLETRLDPPIVLAIPDTHDTFFLSKPETGFSLLGFGTFLSITAWDQQRFNIIKSEFNSILNDWIPANQATTGTLPVAFMGFAFADDDKMTEQWQDLPNTVLIIPELLIREENGEQTLIANFRLDNENQSHYFDRLHKHLSTYLQQHKSISVSEHHNLPERFNSVMDEDWLQLSHNALSEISAGTFDKLVISRQLSHTLSAPIAIQPLFEKLKQHYPSCTLLCYQYSDKTIIAASPENLLSLQHPFIQSDAIGGTVLREKTTNPSPDSLPARFGHGLLTTGNDSVENRKLLKEHLIIAQDIYQRLDPLCQSLKMPVSPVLMKLHNLYHLETPIQGRLMAQFDIFDVINALHPTPAVAGFPADSARQWLLKNENYQRGWYTGAFGWLDGQKNGEFSVMLRCALIKDDEINLFAGAGLIAESDPELEWYETETKMQTILEML